MPCLSNMPEMLAISPVGIIEHTLRAFDEHPEIGSGHTPEHFKIARGFNDADAFVVEIRDAGIEPNDNSGFHSPPLNVRLNATQAPDRAPVSTACPTSNSLVSNATLFDGGAA